MTYYRFIATDFKKVCPSVTFVQAVMTSLMPPDVIASVSLATTSLIWATVILVFCSGSAVISNTADSPSRRAVVDQETVANVVLDTENAICPLPLFAMTGSRPNLTGSGSGGCRCIGLTEIRCRGLTTMPDFRLVSPYNHPFEAEGRNTIVYRELDISRQWIREVGPEAFVNLRLRKIILSFNPLGDGLSARAFTGVASHLTEIHLAACQLRTLPVGLFDGLTELRYLHLWKNRLEKIPAHVFDGAVNLRELVMWGNLIEELDEQSLTGLSQLKRLDLERNRLSIIHKRAFVSQRHLFSLHLSDNGLKTLQADMFSSLVSLRVLKLDRNGLEFVYPRSFHGLHNLVSLSLGENRISFLPDDIFAGLHNLSALYLQGNRLEHVWTKTFSGLRSLRTLNLSGNRLSNLPDGVFHDSPALLRLSLDRNRLRTLRRCAVARTARVRFVSLIDNPVLCECRLAAWLVVDNDDDVRIRRRTDSHAGGAHGAVVSVWGTCQVPPEELDGGEGSAGDETGEAMIVSSFVEGRLMSIGNPVQYRSLDCIATTAELQNECSD